MMKKSTLPLVTGPIVALLALGIPAKGALAASVVLDGQPFTTSVPPLDYNGRILVPMRDIFEELGATVTWTQYDQTINASRPPDGFHPGVSLEMQIGNPSATVNGQPVTLDQPPVLYYNYTLVPLRFVSEALGAQVNWDDPDQIAIISTDDGHGHWYHGPGHFGNWPSGGANYWRQGGAAVPAPGYWPGGLPQNWNNGGYHPGPVFQPPYPGGQPDYGQYGASHPNQHHPSLVTGAILGGLLVLGLESSQHRGGGHGNAPVATAPAGPGAPNHGSFGSRTSPTASTPPTTVSVPVVSSPVMGATGKHGHGSKTGTGMTGTDKTKPVAAQPAKTTGVAVQPTPVPTTKPERVKPTTVPAAKPVMAKPTPLPVIKTVVVVPTPAPVVKPVMVKPTPVPMVKPVMVKPTPVPAAKPVMVKPTPAPTAKPVMVKPTMAPTPTPVPMATPAPTSAPKGKKPKDRKPKPTPAP